MDLDTTIVAVSSPVGRSTKSLVRASGSNAVSGAEKLGLSPVPQQMCASRLLMGDTTLPVLVCMFSAGSSYTGQDTIEIQLPNNQQLVDGVIQHLIEATNGRHADAGEFTARAFFNGRISLTAAEGVCATISANNDAELRAASLLRKGALAKIVETVASDIATTLAKVEAGIDFVDEEDVVTIDSLELQKRIEDCMKTMRATLDGRIPMETLRHLPQVVLAGAPNAGKSTVFNALLGQRRVVVSSAAGTTRDAISEPVLFDDKEAMLIDVAGIEDATDTLSASAQGTALHIIESCDVVLWCVEPGGTPPPMSDAIVVHTKADVPHANNDAICATTGLGIAALRTKVSTHLRSMPLPREGALALLPRHEQYLRDAISCLEDSLAHVSTPELVATSLRLALDATGAISGAITPDEVLGQVFASFCVGK